jgi:hypothetical protein
MALRIAVSYAYVERPNTRRNLEFFLRHGLDSSVAFVSIVVKGRGLHSSTFLFNLSALCGIGGARRGCVALVEGVLGGI